MKEGDVDPELSALASSAAATGVQLLAATITMQTTVLASAG